jgi:ribosomal protein L11 methyltransferase
LTLQLSAGDVPKAEALLTLAGAETIALRDAADEPVLEPEPSTTPLWPNVTLEALFREGMDLGPLHKLLSDVFDDASVTIDALDESAWQPALWQPVLARPIGARLWLAPADAGSPPGDRVAIRINMGLAFGTGEHPTTALCLEWLERHVDDGVTMLDYGCGSGVLALAALALGAHAAYAIDNDPQALLAARANAVLNDAAARLFVGRPDELPDVRVDVLAANILAEPLVELGPTFAKHLAPGGRIVLAGILEPQAPRVAAVYAAYFEDIEHASHGGWVRLSARRKAS